MSQVWGLIVTYKRPHDLRNMLEAIARQTRQLAAVWVVDNGDDALTEGVAASHGARYINSGENLGPAGGIAVGMHEVMREAADDDWLVLFDDDDPPLFDDMVDTVVTFGNEMVLRDTRTAAVGAHGGRYNPKRGTWRRYGDDELVGPLPVDVIHGGALPCYRIGALKEVGVFDPALFFGFEEGEFGLRLRKQQYSLYIDGSLAHRLRQHVGQLGLQRSSLRTPASKASWRRYYGVRNSVILARRYGAPWTPLLVAVGGSTKGTIALVKSRRAWRDLTLPSRGAIHGILGQLGRTINPSTSSK